MGKKRVLVVDDEPAIGRLVAAALSREGYEVYTAPHPIQALETAKRTIPCFDLVLSDVVMPEMSGPGLVRNIKQVCPNAAVVLMSGDIASAALPEDAAFIRKPFLIKDLYSIVKKAFSESGRQPDLAAGT